MQFKKWKGKFLSMMGTCEFIGGLMLYFFFRVYQCSSNYLKEIECWIIN